MKRTIMFALTVFAILATVAICVCFFSEENKEQNLEEIVIAAECTYPEPATIDGYLECLMGCQPKPKPPTGPQIRKTQKKSGKSMKLSLYLLFILLLWIFYFYMHKPLPKENGTENKEDDNNSRLINLFLSYAFDPVTIICLGGAAPILYWWIKGQGSDYVVVLSLFALGIIIFSGIMNIETWRNLFNKEENKEGKNKLNDPMVKQAFASIEYLTSYRIGVGIFIGSTGQLLEMAIRGPLKSGNLASQSEILPIVFLGSFILMLSALIFALISDESGNEYSATHFGSIYQYLFGTLTGSLNSLVVMKIIIDQMLMP